MNVLFVACPFVDEVAGRVVPIGNDAVRAVPPLGVYQLAAVVRAAGHDVAIADLTALGTTHLADGQLAGVDVVCLSATTLSWPVARFVATEIRQARPDVRIVAGGVHPTLFDRWVLERTAVDFVVRGEGEDSLVALLAASCDRAATSRPSTACRGSTATASSCATPQPASSAFTSWQRHHRQRGTSCLRARTGLAVETSRGCAFDCSFCSTPYRRSWRALPADAVADRFEATAAFLGRTTERSTYSSTTSSRSSPGV